VIGTPQHLRAAQAIADRTTTLVRDEGVLPLSTGPTAVLTTGWGSSTAPAPQRLASLMAARGASASALPTGSSPTQQTIDAAVAAARSADVIVAVTNKAWTDSGQQRLVTALIATGKPVIVLAVRDPYDIAHFPDAPAYLAGYSYADVALESAVRVMYGELDPTGKLPVTIPTADDPTATLHPFGRGLALTQRR
jgi:beta-N-acetylhexosaminidase